MMTSDIRHLTTDYQHSAEVEALRILQATTRKVRQRGISTRMWLLVWATAAVVFSAFPLTFEFFNRADPPFSALRARENLADESVSSGRREMAGTHLELSTVANIQAMRAASRSHDRDLADKAKAWLEHLRQVINDPGK